MKKITRFSWVFSSVFVEFVQCYTIFVTLQLSSFHLTALMPYLIDPNKYITAHTHMTDPTQCPAGNSVTQTELCCGNYITMNHSQKTIKLTDDREKEYNIINYS